MVAFKVFESDEEYTSWYYTVYCCAYSEARGIKVSSLPDGVYGKDLLEWMRNKNGKV
jgi:hypothetical protein